MLKWIRSIDWLAINTSALLLCGLLAVASWLPHGQSDNQQTQQASDDKTNDLLLGISPEGWTAIFTGLLTISTIGLWVFTRKAAVIAERTLTELERPWFLVSDMDHASPFAEVNAEIKFRVINYGKQVGIITGIRGGSMGAVSVNIEDIPMKEAPSREIGSSVGPDKFADFRIPIPIAFTPEDRMHLKDGNAEYVTRGVVLYRGLANKRCETGFCWRYDRERDRFVPHGGETHNYVT